MSRTHAPRAEQKESELPGTSYYLRTGHEDPHTDLVSTLRADKEALKSALKAAIAQRDELLERMKGADSVRAGWRTDLEKEVSELRKECAELMRRLDSQRRKEQRTVAVLETRNRELEEEVRRLRRKHKSRSIKDIEDLDRDDAERPSADLLKYSNFVFDKIREVPELQSLWKGRMPSSRRFLSSLDSGLYDDCLLRTLQFVSDVLVFHTHDKRSRSHSPERLDTEEKAMQTISDQGTNTTPFRPREKADTGNFRPEVPAFLMNTTASTDGFLSPTSMRSGMSARVEDDYTRLMDESEQLLSTLHFQNDRLLRLNSQMHQTMRGKRSDSAERRPVVQVSPPLETVGVGGLSTVQESFSRDELSTERRDSISERSLTSPKSEQPARKVLLSAQKSRITKKPTAKKPIPPKNEEKVMLPLRHEDNWSSVSDFFGTKEQRKSITDKDTA